MKIKIISGISYNKVIGRNNSLPWEGSYKEDMAYFRKMTTDSTVIMGRKTYNSIGKPLYKRRNIVLTSRVVPKIEGVEMFTSMQRALDTCENNVWIIGGAQVYAEGMQFAEELHLTVIPETISGENLVYFPNINLDLFYVSDRIELNKDKNLYVNIYLRK